MCGTSVFALFVDSEEDESDDDDLEDETQSQGSNLTDMEDLGQVSLCPCAYGFDATLVYISMHGSGTSSALPNARVI